MKPLIVYFSRPGQNYVCGEIRNLVVGNTRVVAELIQAATGAPMFALEQAAPYSTDYSTCIEEAKQDQRRDARPELKAYPDNLESYDTIYLGYPNYWGTMPMAVFTFLEHFDFTKKTIRPFCTHEGGGLGHSEADIRRLCPDTQVTKGLAVQGAKAKAAESAVRAWLEEL